MTGNGFDYHVIMIGSGLGSESRLQRQVHGRFPGTRRYDQALTVLEVTP
jgi:hypothetical protein